MRHVRYEVRRRNALFAERLRCGLPVAAEGLRRIVREHDNICNELRQLRHNLSWWRKRRSSLRE